VDVLLLQGLSGKVIGDVCLLRSSAQGIVHLLEQVKMIQNLDPEEKNMVFKIVDTFLTQKKFKDFFQKNIAAL
jgi:hypothetical protein